MKTQINYIWVSSVSVC